MSNKERFLTQLGANIKAARKARKLSQERLAERLPINANALSKIETGQTGCLIWTLKSIADALEMDVKELL